MSKPVSMLYMLTLFFVLFLFNISYAEESIETAIVPISIKVAVAVVVFIVTSVAFIILWTQTLKSTVKRNREDIIVMQAKIAIIQNTNSLMDTSVAVVKNDLEYIKSSLIRIEEAVTGKFNRDTSLK